MDAAAIVENAGNSGRERRLGKGCEHVQTWSGVFHNRLENASRFPRAPTGPSWYIYKKDGMEGGALWKTPFQASKSVVSS